METWVTPAWAIQFFFRSQWKFINGKIEEAILEADEAGVKVIGLGALNKNEALNGGGKLFVENNPDLNIRVVHGNTLTAAAVLKKVPSDVKEVFVTGATSKLGRAISLYLAERGVKVTMLTQSTERFQKIRDEASPKAQIDPPPPDFELATSLSTIAARRSLPSSWWQTSFVALCLFAFFGMSSMSASFRFLRRRLCFFL